MSKRVVTMTVESDDPFTDTEEDRLLVDQPAVRCFCTAEMCAPYCWLNQSCGCCRCGPAHREWLRNKIDGLLQ